jgi:hypothetical protein
MPIDNLAEKHFNVAEKEAIADYLKQISNLIKPLAANLTPEERSSFGTVGETNKLIINKVKDYYDNHPEMASTDVDWMEFRLDYEDRAFLQSVHATLQTIAQVVDNTRIAHDYDNYYASLNDYDYSTFKLRKNPEYEVKVGDLKQFFNRTGTKTGEDDKPE